MALIECRELVLGYQNRVVVSELSFTVSQGDYVCVVGENGSGKSTLIKALLGIKQPLSGSIQIAPEIRGEIGYLPQQTQVQRDFPASVNEVVLAGRICKGRLFFTRSDREAANENMRLLGIYDIKDSCYRELSGGQQQRVLLARALCAAKSLLLLDEPVTGLDPLVTAELYGIIKRINEGAGTTIIMVSHDIGSAVKNATHILHLNKRPMFWGKTEDYIHSEVGKAFIETGGCCHV